MHSLESGLNHPCFNFSSLLVWISLLPTARCLTPPPSTTEALEVTMLTPWPSRLWVKWLKITMLINNFQHWDSVPGRHIVRSFPKLEFQTCQRKRSGIPEYFPTWNKKGRPSPECRYWVGMFLNARDGIFPRFFPQKSGSREMPFGNAALYLVLLWALFWTLPKE